MDSKTMIGARLAELRKQAGISQEKVAEYLGVSRQAVTKWENDISKPSTSNLIKLAELYKVHIEELTGNDVEAATELNRAYISTGKESWIFIGVSAMSIMVYLVAALIQKNISVSVTAIEMVIFVGCQLFLHLYLTNAIRSNSMNGIAGFDEKIEYNFTEVKKLLAQINLSISMVSSLFIIFFTVFNLTKLEMEWMNGLLVMLYIINFIAVVLVSNYKMTSRIYAHAVDEKRAKKSLPISGAYVISLCIGIVSMLIISEIRQIENNSMPALVLAALMILGVIISSVGFFLENRRINNWNPQKSIYKIGRSFVICEIVCFIMYITMFLVK